ncbi:hypothetical protein CsSME_00027284 [Camellia sinensis var. sinensis]
MCLQSARARECTLERGLVSHTRAVKLPSSAFGNHGLLAGYGAKPIGAGLGRDTSGTL